MTGRRRGSRYSDEEWAAKEALATELLAQCGATIESVTEAIRGMPAAGTTEEDLHEAAVLCGAKIPGPPPGDEQMRPIAALFGMVVASSPAAEQRRAS